VPLLSLVLHLFLVFTLSACGRIPRGLLYTDTVQPFCTDLRGTTLGSKATSSATKAVEVPLSPVDLSAEWSTRAIGDIAKNNGINVVHSCDLRRESYVLGIWRRDEILIYGD
jgi:hypothetical protein